MVVLLPHVGSQKQAYPMISFYHCFVIAAVVIYGSL